MLILDNIMWEDDLRKLCVIAELYQILFLISCIIVSKIIFDLKFKSAKILYARIYTSMFEIKAN